MQHIVKKQVIDLCMEMHPDIFKTQQRVSTQFYELVVPLMEMAFNRVSKEEEVISIDQVEIDLGHLTPECVEQGQWIEAVYSKLIEKMEWLIAQGLATKSPLSKPRAYNIFQQWFFYMRNGYLPWNALEINESWYENVLQTLASDYDAVEFLRKEILENSRVLRRIILQHSEKFLVALTEILTAESQATIPGAISEIQAIVKISGSSIFLPEDSPPVMTGENNLSSHLWQMILTLVARPELHWSSGKIVHTILESWIRNESSLRKIRDGLPGMLSFTETFLQEIEIKLKASPAAVYPEPEITAENLLERITDKPSAKEDPHSGEDQSGFNKTLDEEGIFLSNAGLVLLHPFLSSFFNRLGLLEDGRFIDPASQHKALHLLHYLATGKKEAAEFELQMAKILCAFPSSGVTEMSVELNAAEIGEAGDLLSACIQQWEVLKNTSPTGLQESFLQRNGKLFSKNGRVQLEVEKKSIDVLLDYLPWNLSLIRLPWMREVLNVNWR